MKVTNPSKIIFPEVDLTKRDLVSYYQSVGDLMLPHVADRPLTLQRFPDGVAGGGFMQKNASSHFPDFIGRVEVPKSGGTVTHPMVGDVEGIAYLANQGTVTFHIWSSRHPQLWHPDRFVIDVDPPEGDVDAARAAALATRDVLTEAGAPPGLMTTGSKGYHVVVLLEPDAGFDAVGRAARGVAALVTARAPDRFTTAFLKKRRGNRVFVDWLRNRPAQTSVAPWSLRPRPHAPAAIPIRWDQLAETDPDRYTAGDHPTGDPHAELVRIPATRLCANLDARLQEDGIVVEDDFDRFGRK